MLLVTTCLKWGNHVTFWTRAGNGGVVDYTEVFKGYAATVDFPACTVWEDIYKQYPDAKILLSVRNPESWFKSCRDTIFTFCRGSGYARFGQWVNSVLLPSSSASQRMISAIIDDPLFHGDFSKENSIKVFNDWKQSVIDKAPKDKLLVYEVKDGWQPLCEFLDIPVPQDLEFPRVNDTAQFQKFVFAMNRQGKAIFTGIMVHFAIGCYVFSNGASI